MKQLFALTRLQLVSLFGVDRIRCARDEKERKRARSANTALIVLAVALVYMSVCYGVLLEEVFGRLGKPELMPALMLCAACVMGFFSCMMRASSVLYRFGDHDMVMSLPLPTRTVALSRLLSFLVFEWYVTLTLLLPAGIIYGLYVSAAWWYWPLYLVLSVLAPLLPAALGGLIGTAFAAALARFKFRTLLETIVQTALVVGVMLLSFNASSLVDSGMAAAFAEGISARLASLYPPALLFTKALGGDLLSILLFVLVNLVAITLFALLLCALFNKLCGFVSARGHVKGYRIKAQRQSGIGRALFKKEWARYTCSSLYLMNTAIGPVLAILGGGYLCFFASDATLETLNGTAQLMGGSVVLLFAVAAGFFVGMAPTTTASVSLEGKTLWLSKTLPFSAADWLRAKLLVSLTIPLVAAVLLAVGLGFRFQTGVLNAVLLFLYPMSIALFTALIGLWSNLKHPRFDWDSEAECIKQGSPVLLAMLASLGATVVSAGLPVLLGMAGLWLAAALLLAASVWLWLYMKANAERLRMALH